MRTIACVLAALFNVVTMATAAPRPHSHGKEVQLAGVRLGVHASTVAKVYGSPRRVQVGLVTDPDQQAGAGAAGMGMPGASSGPMSELSGVMSMATGMVSNMMAGMGYPTSGSAAPGMPGGAPGMPGMPGAEGGMGGQAQPAAPQTVNWIYERLNQGVVYIFGYDEEGRVIAITVGDGYSDSVNRGGSRRPYAGARTSRGIGLGSTFREVIKAYGYPEIQQSAGNNETVLTYYDKYGVAFSMKQGVMRVTAITIREMPKAD
ncbi:MAG TPA: hypothetical protein VHR86_02990 [Armatimonadota bacterium]|nr:hypothetical protein [Armatimonadota bacterium]